MSTLWPSVNLSQNYSKKLLAVLYQSVNIARQKSNYLFTHRGTRNLRTSLPLPDAFCRQGCEDGKCINIPYLKSTTATNKSSSGKSLWLYIWYLQGSTFRRRSVSAGRGWWCGGRRGRCSAAHCLDLCGILSFSIMRLLPRGGTAPFLFQVMLLPVSRVSVL